MEFHKIADMDANCDILQLPGEDSDVQMRRAEYLVAEFPNASEIREIFWAWGPETFERNYRVTWGTSGNMHVSDWHIGWNTRFDNIEFADEYDRIM